MLVVNGDCAALLQGLQRRVQQVALEFRHVAAISGASFAAVACNGDTLQFADEQLRAVGHRVGVHVNMDFSYDARYTRDVVRPCQRITLAAVFFVGPERRPVRRTDIV